MVENSLITKIKKYIKWKKFEKRIQAKLPKHNPTTGEPIYWNIHVMFRNEKFDTATGKRISGYPCLSITQIASGFIPIDNRCYKYDLKKKKMVPLKAIWQ